jgi:hypothetical protein
VGGEQSFHPLVRECKGREVKEKKRIKDASYMMGGCWVTKRGVDLIFFVFTDGSKRKGKKMHFFSVPPDPLCMPLNKNVAYS